LPKAAAEVGRVFGIEKESEKEKEEKKKGTPQGGNNDPDRWSGRSSYPLPTIKEGKERRGDEGWAKWQGQYTPLVFVLRGGERKGKKRKGGENPLLTPCSLTMGKKKKEQRKNKGVKEKGGDDLPGDQISMLFFWQKGVRNRGKIREGGFFFFGGVIHAPRIEKERRRRAGTPQPQPLVV